MADKLPDNLDDLLNSIRNEEEASEAPSSEEVDKKIRDYELEKRNKELADEFLKKVREKIEKKKEEENNLLAERAEKAESNVCGVCCCM